MMIVADDAVKEAPNFNEAEIRFHIVDPIVRSLGYPGSNNVYLNLEEKLEYPYMHIGRRSKKDQPLGFPDYRAGLKGARGSFIVEAKAGNAPITSREIEQAHSYASHAQVGANYFILCNGDRIIAYETLSGPNVTPLMSIPLNEVNKRFHELENIFSPENLLKNCQVKYDMRLKLSDGLGSSVKIQSWYYRLSDYTYRILVNGEDCTALLHQTLPQLSAADQQLELLKSAFELRVSGGIAERGDDGRITAKVEFTGATIHNHQAMAIMGITDATFATADQFISKDPNSPTIFDSLKDFSVPKGTNLPLFFGGSAKMEGNLVGDMFIKAAMHYNKGKIQGQYMALSKQNISFHGFPPLILDMEFSGEFELILNI